MQVQSVNKFSTSFKANFFTVQKRGSYFDLDKISTDNAENLGKAPVLQTKTENVDCEFPMTYDGKYYTTELPSYIDKYRIFYKDTGKYEKDGEEQKFNPLLLKKIAVSEDRKYNNLPPEQSFVKGEAGGKVFVNTFDIPQNIPVILVLDEVKKEETLILDIPHNVKGVITSSCDFGVLSHVANLARNRISAMSIIWDEDKYNNLKELNGKYITLNNENGILEYKEVKPNQTKIKSEFQEKIKVPKLEKTERLLNFEELTPQNCGSKGYRLAVMQKLAKEEKLKDITIPNGFVIPEGYINKYKEYVNTDDKEEWQKRITEGVYVQDTENKIKELGLPRQNLIIRSNFNTEDMGTFSSAGIYESESAGSTYSIIDQAVFDIVRCSFEESEISKKVHKKYGIKDSEVQPSVIVQEEIHPDYEFTLYTDDGNDNIVIELSDCSLRFINPGSSLIKYNKKTKELTPERKLSPFAEYTLDEKGNIIDQKHPKDKLEENWKVLSSLLGVVTSGALVLEKFFKHPQDVEGGIKDGKVYFWQTRDIVAKAVKRV